MAFIQVLMITCINPGPAEPGYAKSLQTEEPDQLTSKEAG